MIDPDSGAFTFEGLHEGGYVEVYLSPTERDMIRPMAEPGQPLWKIQKGLLDYRAVLLENIARLDLATDEGVTRARMLAAEIKAVGWQHEMWERLLSDPTVLEKEQS